MRGRAWTCLLGFDKRVWKCYFQQDEGQVGQWWLWRILTIVIVFKIGYDGVAVLREWQHFSAYEGFLVASMLLLVLACTYFLHNATQNYQLNELKLYVISFGVYFIYSVVQFGWSMNDLINVQGCHIFRKGVECPGNKDPNYWVSLLVVVQFVLDIVGIVAIIPLLFLTIAITFFVYDELRTTIYHHLDGNRVVYKDFQDITLTRAILKLDFLANLEFFTAFIFVIFESQPDAEHAVEHGNVIFAGCMAGLLAFTVIVQLCGWRAIVSARKWRYNCYLGFRVVAEFAKIGVLLVVLTAGGIWGEWSLKKSKENILEYHIFITFACMHAIFSLTTFAWTQKRVRAA